MNIPRLKQWVAALRSGEYQQTHGALRRRATRALRQKGLVVQRPVGFCCLGVVQDLYAKDGIGSWDDREDMAQFSVGGSESIVGLVSFVSKDLLGYMDRDIKLPIPTREPTEPYTLAYLNDNGFTFPQIADLIEYFLIKPQENQHAKERKHLKE